MKKLLLSFSLFAIYYLIFAINASAAGECVPIYGGGVSCPQEGRIIVNKTVKNPQTGAFVDNLNINDPKFSAGQTVNFKITVTNTGDKVVSDINAQDIFPQFVNPDKPAGLNFRIDRLNPGESGTFDLSGKVVSADKLPADKSVVCVINQAIVTAEDKTSQDNAQLCIQKQVLGAVPPVTKGGQVVFPQPQITQAPSTGPEMLGLIALLPTGVAGFLLRRKAAK